MTAALITIPADVDAGTNEWNNSKNAGEGYVISIPWAASITQNDDSKQNWRKRKQNLKLDIIFENRHNQFNQKHDGE